MKVEKIIIGDKEVTAYEQKLQENVLVLFVGSKGYVMCGYLDMAMSDKCADVAVKITGVNSIKAALSTTAADVSGRAAAMGIKKGQPICDILKIIS